MGALAIIGLATAIIPLISAGIELAEQLFGSKKGQGPVKKEAVVSSLGVAWDNAQAEKLLGTGVKGITSKEITPLASMLIDLMVGIANRAGTFQSEPIIPQPKVDGV